MTDRSPPWRRRHPLALDVAIAVAVVVLDTVTTLAGWTWWPSEPSALAWVMLALQGLACLSLIARRRAPLLVFAVLGGFTLAVTLLVSPAGLITPAAEDTLWAPFATVLAAYGPLYYRPRDRTASYVALALFTIVVARPWDPSIMVITIAMLRTAVGPLLALYFDARRRLVRALTERAERAERERHLLAEQARADERARLAGEMHDVVSHRVSLMVLQAGALRVTATDDATRRAAEELRSSGSQALEELRDLVGILRATPDGDPTPTVTGLPGLVEESIAVGMPAELIEEGDRTLASPVVGRTVFRIVREALTNVRKHAPGARVRIHVRYERERVRLSVRNTEATHPASRALTETGSGLGIAHLRRSVDLVHGTLRAGPASDGGFSVEATLPAYVSTSGEV
jgi:signal transduction histidine kinase